jgi:hypothetical protein
LIIGFITCFIVAASVDEKEVKAIFDMFAAFFTMEQVKNTLIANLADPDKQMKTINDLKFKQGIVNICSQQLFIVID